MPVYRSHIAAEYYQKGYTGHYNPIDAEVVAESCCECGETPRYIGLKRDEGDRMSYIAISYCNNCGKESEF